MLRASVGEGKEHIGGRVETTHGQVWVGRLRPANDDAAGLVTFVMTESVDKACQGVIQAIRAKDQEGVIVALCTGTLAQKVLALTSGADDCITLPGTFTDALSLLKDIGPRGWMTDPPGGSRLVVDPHSHAVTVDGRTIPIGARELRLLEELQKRRGQVVSNKYLEHLLWGSSDARSRQALRQLTRRLRGRLGPAAGSLVLVRGVGYMLT